MKLLLIEDNLAMQTSLQRSLERRGIQVLTCGDGQRALALWQSSLPDAVLLDLSLPGRDGLEVLSDARAAGLRTPVIILTARGTVGDRILGLPAADQRGDEVQLPGTHADVARDGLRLGVGDPALMLRLAHVLSPASPSCRPNAR